MSELYQLIIFILASAGAALIVIISSLFAPLRKWLEVKHKENTKNLFYWWAYSISKCSLCFGVYSGTVCYLMIYKNVQIEIIPFIFIGSLSAYFASLYTEKLKQRY